MSQDAKCRSLRSFAYIRIRRRILGDFMLFSLGSGKCLEYLWRVALSNNKNLPDLMKIREIVSNDLFRSATSEGSYGNKAVAEPKCYICDLY